MANYKRNDGYTIRVTKEEFYAGGNSDPRNPNILKMFGFVNVGERAGSGVDKIMTAWAEQNKKKPEFDFSERSDRVTLKLEVGQVVYIPGAADIRNENTNQEKATAVSKEEKILGIVFENREIEALKTILEFIFDNIDEKYKSSREKYGNKKLILLQNFTFENDGYKIIKKYINIVNKSKENV